MEPIKDDKVHPNPRQCQSEDNVFNSLDYSSIVKAVGAQQNQQLEMIAESQNDEQQSMSVEQQSKLNGFNGSNIVIV